MDRDPAEARFCAECSRHHSAEEGDLWAESSMLGLRITYFACMDGKVYDITGDRQLFLNIIPTYVSGVCSRSYRYRPKWTPAFSQMREKFQSISFRLSHVDPL